MVIENNEVRAAIYVRTSTELQTLEQQINPLVKHCEDNDWPYKIFEDRMSGSKETRPGLGRMMEAIRLGEFNAVMIWKLDRLGRSLQHLLQLVQEFNNRNIQFICFSPEVNTRTPQGRFFLQIIGAVSELEREMIRERIMEKHKELKSRGVHIGRPHGSKDKKGRRKTGYYLRYAKDKEKYV